MLTLPSEYLTLIQVFCASFFSAHLVSASNSGDWCDSCAWQAHGDFRVAHHGLEPG
jgi:hypothetical protein